ncbi:MAG: helix-turn-helix domain-containing protein [Saprospiraceae bacterium]|nr:helix-turn-helix domain-containing protein [Saprospiraceae bacterium]MCF8250935.1 helix-turn-helix domain-containing protein [Saprospiraceae bacterium]MCF8281913.1 helix-turn-helix domain-containing protein [Bacteroidales bacterium]MCF8311900.1 helix-turn-helix domain-containing protein [Saprospiraceae bacterium]MCF8441908.1 helix-turn-helix domain-containing protein [Saprospiraceae bacterium]
MSLGKNIELLRKWLGDSQLEFGKRFGLGRSVVGKWESGISEPSVSVLLVLEDLSGVPFRRLASEALSRADLFGGEGKGLDVAGEMADLKRRVERLETEVK